MFFYLFQSMGKTMHYCSYCDYQSDRRWDVSRHEAKKHQNQNIQNNKLQLQIQIQIQVRTMIRAFLRRISVAAAPAKRKTPKSWRCPILISESSNRNTREKKVLEQLLPAQKQQQQQCRSTTTITIPTPTLIIGISISIIYHRPHRANEP